MENLNQYRLGNLVFGIWEDYDENSHESLCRITGLSENQDIGEGWYYSLENIEIKDVENYCGIKPIELTEEWLLKFGFEPTTPGYWSNGILELGYTTSDENIQYEYISITSKTEMTDIKHVHQLQNLYFALTGEELTLKEEK